MCAAQPCELHILVRLDAPHALLLRDRARAARRGRRPGGGGAANTHAHRHIFRVGARTRAQGRGLCPHETSYCAVQPESRKRWCIRTASKPPDFLIAIDFFIVIRVTGRPRGYYRKFAMSRIALRDYGLSGQIPGLTKSSW